jgi:CHAT domain-containing protein
MSPVAVSKMLADIMDSSMVKSDASLRLWSLVAKGATDLDVNIPSSKLAWTEALKLAGKLGEKGWEARANCELGIIAFLEGNTHDAGHMVGKALISEISRGDVAGQIRALEKLGDGFVEVNRDAEAMVFYDRAISLAGTTPDAGFAFTAYEGKARVLTRQGKLSEAKECLQTALTAATQGKMLMDQIQVLILLGERAIRTGERPEAIRALEQASALGQQYEWYYMVTQAMFDLTTLYRDLGDLKTAEDRASLGVTISRQLNSLFYYPRDLTILADLKVLKKEYTEADELFEKAETVIAEILANNHAGPYWSNSLAAAMSNTYLHHFKLRVQRGDVEGAVNVIERVRGRTAASVLENGTRVDTKESPEAMELETTVAQVQRQLMQSRSLTEHTKLKEQLVGYERRLEWARSSESSPQRWTETAAGVNEIQRVLQNDELILEYVLDEPHAYCVWISKDGLGIEILKAGRAQIEQLAAQNRSDLRNKRNDVSTQKQLSQILLPAIANEPTSRRLIIVADGLLHLLPFETLPDPNGAMLVQSKIISYVPASTVLYALRNRTSVAAGGRPFLGIGDAAYENQGEISANLPTPNSVRERLVREISDALGVALYDLPQTREEITEISKVLGKESVLLLGPHATETAFKAQPLSEFNIIHLAAHGYADTQFPERSGLVLGVDPSSNDDGLLQAREIVRLRLKAELVTLSACDTGVGKLAGEAGVTDLPEAFLISGAKSVVASLWSADDNSTLALMTRFYVHIAEGQDTATALREAKLDLLSKYGPEASPYYWGGFVLVGDGSAIAWEHQ